MGLLNPLYDAVSWIIVVLHSALTPIFGAGSGWSWGLAIIGLVVIIRTLLIPLFVKQIKSQRGMQLLAPQLKELQQKHKGDREKLAQEQMKLYKDTGTNPLSSCLPILAQMPIFFALFHVLNGIAKNKAYGVLTNDLVHSARDATVFGAPISQRFVGADTVSVQIVTAGMIVAMCASQFITQRQLMRKNMPATALEGSFAQQQKVLLYVFPLIFAVTGVNFPVGVLLYWLTTNLWTMGQQLIVIRRMPAPGSAAEQARSERLARRAAGSTPTAPSAPSALSDGARPGKSARKPLPAASGSTVSGSTVSGSTVSGASGGGSGPGSPAPGRSQPKRTSRSQRKKR